MTLVLSLFTIVFGELVPKSLALAHTEAFALRLSGFIEVLLRVLGPLVRVLTAITTASPRMLGAGDQAAGRDEHRGAARSSSSAAASRASSRPRRSR